MSTMSRGGFRSNSRTVGKSGASIAGAAPRPGTRFCGVGAYTLWKWSSIKEKEHKLQIPKPISKSKSLFRMKKKKNTPKYKF